MLSHTSKYAALTDEQLKLLGIISVEWSNIEFMLGVILSRLLYTPEFLSRTYTSNLSAFKLIEAIYESLEIHKSRYGNTAINHDVTERVKIAVDSANKLRATRNKVSHFCWSRSHDTEIFGTNFSGGVPSKKKEKKNMSVLSNHELLNMGNECHKIAGELMKLAEVLPEIDEVNAIQSTKEA